VIIPTYNRVHFLRGLLASIAKALVPPDVKVVVTVVDNQSTDETHAVVKDIASRCELAVRYLLQTRPGKSAALNAGIRDTSGDIVAFLDDDEIVSPGWFHCLARLFEDEQIDFISGRCLPRWGTSAPPPWLPPGYPAVIGALDGGTAMLEFEREYDGTLSGGNSAIRRRVLERVGLFSTQLGPRADIRLLCCEDEDIHLRLIDGGARGVYAPELLVYHHVHPERLTRRYHRRWCFWRGVSKAVVYEARQLGVRYIGRVPRFLYGSAMRGVLRVLCPAFGDGSAAARFNGELAVWDLAGFLFGRYLYRPPETREERVRHEAAAESARCRVAAVG
jgi:GT2 family glycosyltransferase